MAIQVPFLDLRVHDEDERARLLGAMERMLTHGRMVMGPEIEAFESAVADYCGRQYGVSVGSGTDALFMGLRALEIGAGDEVITTALSWVATANAIAMTGATPVFADIRDDLNIDPASVERLITPRTRVLLVVNYTGRMAEMETLLDICEHHQLHLVEDGSQAFGALRNGKRCGSFGVLSAISHNPMKVFAATGEAGTVLCDDPALRERLVMLRYNGTVNRETCIEPSLNGRMDTLQAAVLLQRLQTFDALIARRREHAAYYHSRLAGCIDLPEEGADERQVYYTFTIRTERRDELERYLAECGIETKVQHRILMSEQPAYRPARGEYATAQQMARTILALPVHEKLSEAQRAHVADSVLAFFAA